MNRVLGDPANPEGELWIVRDAWEGGFSLRAVTGSGMLVSTSLLAAFGRADPGLILADLWPLCRFGRYVDTASLGWVLAEQLPCVCA